MGKYPSMSGGCMSWCPPPNAEYSHPHEEGPMLQAEMWLYTLVALNEMITRTREKP